MEKIHVEVENIKCGGCANTVKSNLLKMEGVEEVNVHIESGEISLNSNANINSEMIYDRLAKLGYPKKGEGNTFQKAKSYVSCAIGKINAE